MPQCSTRVCTTYPQFPARKATASRQGINNRNQVVGSSPNGRDGGIAFISTRGRLTDLNRLIVQSYRWFLQAGAAINDRGVIAATALDRLTGKRHGVLLVFVPTITRVSPGLLFMGATGVQITVHGRSFLPASEVFWNGAPLITTFLGTTQLKALVPAALVAGRGSAAVTVFNPEPGEGGVSSAPRSIDID